MTLRVILRGGGDLASGVALRLIHVGIQVIITELPRPMAVRRAVAFAQSIYDGNMQIESIPSARAADVTAVLDLLAAGVLPVIIDPDLHIRHQIPFDVLIDGRMTKQPPEIGMDAASLVIGLGPGFTVNENCHAVIETKRGPFLGRVYWKGSAEPDSGQPDQVLDHQMDRVLRAPQTGILTAYAAIGTLVPQGTVIAEVNGQQVIAPFTGCLRGLLLSGTPVDKGLKIGDLDPRQDIRLSQFVSDKALAVGGGVLEAILSRVDLRAVL